MTSHIVKPNGVQVKDLESLIKNCCPVCGYPLTVTTSWSKGVPFAVCTNVDGGYTHLRQQISQELYDEFWYYQKAQLEELDFGVWQEDSAEQNEEASE